MMSHIKKYFGVISAVLFFLPMVLFTLDQRQYALIFQFGEVVRIIDQPGLHWKLPFIQSARYFDKRIQTIDSDTPELFNTREKKNVYVDSFVKWRVVDVKQYYKSVGGHAAAELRLKQTINDGLRAEFGHRTVSDVISGQRDQVMEAVRRRADFDARKIGIQILDVRLKRVDFTSEISSTVHERMRSERLTVANQLRSEGAAEAERIRAEAEKNREIILVEAYKKAQEIKGEGEAKAASIYSTAFGKNPEFYSFWQSMEAYRQTFKGKQDVLVLDTHADFFRHMRKSHTGDR
jgi:membrane protease subunit HflC